MNLLSYDEHLKKFHEQKRLEVYQNNRVLIRPETTKITVAVYLSILLVGVISFFVILFSMSTLKIWINILISVIFLFFTIEGYGRVVAIKFIECYQHYASEEKRRKCLCVPSCSEYAIICLKKYEFIHALLKIRKRLFITCRGDDYIIDPP